MAAAPPPPQQNLFEAARQLEMSKIPLFFGDPTKDHFTPETWLFRLEQARVVGQWNDDNTAIYMNMSFRENAIKWRDGVHDMGVNTNNWNELRAAFLRFYAPGATIRSCVANLDLKQGATESVRDFGPRVARVIHDIKQLAPPYAFPDPLFAAPIVGLAGYNDLADDVRQNAHQALVRIGEQRISDLISIHIFVAGLKPFLRDKCITRVFNTYYEAYTHATTLEHNMTDPKKSAHVNNVEEDSTSDAEIDELEVEINRLRSKINQKQKRNQPRPAGRKNYSAYVCRYCNIKGHIQSECRKRIAAGAPMVPHTPKPKSVNETEQQPSTAPPPQPAAPAAPLQPFNPFAYDPTVNNLYNPHLNMY